MAYVHEPYPKWLHAPGGRTRIVNSFEEQQKAGPEWVESVLDLPKAAATPEPSPEAPQASKTIASLAAGADAVLKRFYSVPSRTITDQVMQLQELDEVREVRDMEELRPGGPRKAVLQAVLARLEQLMATSSES